MKQKLNHITVRLSDSSMMYINEIMKEYNSNQSTVIKMLIQHSINQLIDNAGNLIINNNNKHNEEDED